MQQIYYNFVMLIQHNSKLVLGDIRKIKMMRYRHKIPRYDCLVIVTKF